LGWGLWWARASHLINLGKAKLTACGYLLAAVVFLINFLLKCVNIFENGNISKMWFKLNIPFSRWCPCSSKNLLLKTWPEPMAFGFQTSQARPKALSGHHQGPAQPGLKGLGLAQPMA